MDITALLWTPPGEFSTHTLLRGYQHNRIVPWQKPYHRKPSKLSAPRLSGPISHGNSGTGDLRPDFQGKPTAVGLCGSSEGDEESRSCSQHPAKTAVARPRSGYGAGAAAEVKDASILLGRNALGAPRDRHRFASPRGILPAAAGQRRPLRVTEALLAAGKATGRVLTGPPRP